MANATIVITQENSVNRATQQITALGTTSVIRLLNSYTPVASTTRAELLAAECTFAGYPSGGYTVAAWTGPGLDSNPGAIISAPSINVEPTSENTVTNQITGGWWETGGETPITLGCFQITPPIQVELPTDQFPLVLQSREGLSG